MGMKLQKAVVVATLVLLACGAAGTKRYYTLANIEQSNESASSVRCHRSVVVTVVDIVAPYDGEKIVYRTDNLEVQFFNYQRWVESPPEMLRKLVSEKLEYLGLFSGVETFLESASDHLVLSLKLLALEEVENAMAAYANEQDRIKSLEAAAVAAEDSVNLVTKLYKSGLTDFQNVLNMEQALLTQQDNLAQSRGLVSSYVVAIYRSLGGGWSMERM